MSTTLLTKYANFFLHISVERWERYCDWSGMEKPGAQAVDVWLRLLLFTSHCDHDLHLNSTSATNLLKLLHLHIHDAHWNDQIRIFVYVSDCS